MGLKDGRRPHVGNVRSQKLIISTVLPLNIHFLNTNACWQLAAANLLTPTHSETMRWCPRISKRPGLHSLRLKVSQDGQKNVIYCSLWALHCTWCVLIVRVWNCYGFPGRMSGTEALNLTLCGVIRCVCVSCVCTSYQQSKVSLNHRPKA